MSISNIEIPNNNNLSCASLSCASLNGGRVTNLTSNEDSKAATLAFYKNRNGGAVINGDFIDQTYGFAYNSLGGYSVVTQSVARVNGNPSGGNVPVDQSFLSCGVNGHLQRLLFGANNDVVIGSGSKTTSDNNGFVWIPSINGIPSGTPDTVRGGYAGLIFNHNNLRLYAWVPSLNAWKYCQFV